MTFELKILICLLFLLNLQTSLASPSDQPEKTDPASFKSFIDYRPKSSQYPESLRSVAGAIESGDEFNSSGKKEEAQASYRHAVELADKTDNRVNRSIEDQLWFLRGFAQENLGQEQKAEQSYDRALKIRPNNLLARFRHALLLKQGNKCEKALPEFQEIEWAVKDLSYEMNFLQGECLMSLSRDEEGVKQFQRAYKKRPSFMPVVKRLLAVHQDMLAKASSPAERSTLESQISAELNAVTKSVPGDRDASIALATMLLDVKDPILEKTKLDQAEALAKKGAEASSYRDDVFVRLLAESQLKKGMLDEAETVIKKGLKEKPNSSELAVAKKQLEIERSLKEVVPNPDPK